jgi:hypothetical protein
MQKTKRRIPQRTENVRRADLGMNCIAIFRLEGNVFSMQE